jgi:uncharacterized alkaline shock family protein YloU
VNEVAALVPRPAPTDAPRGRGRLTIAPVVVERVVEDAVRRVRGVRPLEGRDPVVVQARVLGTVASVSVRLALAYPSPVRETCGQVRSSIGAQVQRLTGISVSRLDVQVTALVPAGPGTGRVR